MESAPKHQLTLAEMRELERKARAKRAAAKPKPKAQPRLRWQDIVR
jgi:hypothetical protein